MISCFNEPGGGGGSMCSQRGVVSFPSDTMTCCWCTGRPTGLNIMITWLLVTVFAAICLHFVPKKENKRRKVIKDEQKTKMMCSIHTPKSKLTAYGDADDV